MLRNNDLTALVVTFTLAFTGSVFSCTGIRLQARDHSVIYGRTLEYSRTIDSKLIVIPRRYHYIGTTPTGQNGLHWTTKYAITGMNVFNIPHTVDGINEKGLAVGSFYFSRYTKYQNSDPSHTANELAPWELPTYLLSECATVNQVKQALRNVKVISVMLPKLGIVLPLHYIVTDASGKSIVIEYQNSKPHIYPNPLGVITNSPPFPWMLTNLAAMKRLHDIPAGDFSSPSRFIRAAIFKENAPPVATGLAGVLQVFHLLNQFDLPRGTIKVVRHSKPYLEYTRWTTVANLKTRRYYFKSYCDQDVRMVDLTKIDPNEKHILWIAINNKQPITNVTNQLQPFLNY